ncbi:unnamed protein product [Aphanomyces euteiches]|nr:hypothetical protein Ae201684P_016481 [Aphanomyces euteiches]
MSGYEPIDPPTPGTAPSRRRYLPVGVGAIFLGLCALYTGNSFFTHDGRSVLDQIPAQNFQAVPQVQTQTQAQPQVQPQDPSAEKAVEAILANLTVAQKVGQMLQVDVGTILRGSRNPHIALNKPVVRRLAKLGIGSYFNSPFDRSSSHELWTASEWKHIIDEINAIYAKENAVPMIYGIDTVHGANYVRGAALFPQPLACASSFNPDLVYRMGEIEAKDSLAAGLAWIFSPIIGIAMHPKWARNYETFGEDPYLVTQLGVAAIRGIQANKRAAASMKHFIAYSNPTSGNDRTDSVVSDFELLNYFSPSFIAAVKEGQVKTAMETYTSVNGEPVLASHKLLDDLLRHDMGFNGLLVSDDDEFHRLVAEHHIAKNDKDAIDMVFNHTSLDMNMVPYKGIQDRITERLVARGELTEARLDESVRRILRLKYDLGLFNKSQTPFVPPTAVGSLEDQKEAKAMADEAIILLKNGPKTPVDAVNPKHVLPIEDPHATVFLTGPLADSKAFLCGGWTIFWQGTRNSSQIAHGISIREGLNRSFANLQYAEGVDTNGRAVEKRSEVLAKAAKSSYTIVVLGEAPYAEKTGDIDNLALPEGQLEYVRQLTAINTTNVIVIVVEGRPRLLNGITNDAAAVLLSFLPCEQGGEAFADILTGRVNPSAKLPITYPKNSGNVHLPYFHRVNTECRDEFAECEMEWTFGSGLSYTSFKYGKITLSQHNVSASGTLTVSVPVTNTGGRAGKETVLLFISQKVRHKYVPERKLLKKFQKISLQPQQTTVVNFTLTAAVWSYYEPQIGQGFKTVVDPGVFHVQIKHDTDCSKATHLCKSFRVVA